MTLAPTRARDGRFTASPAGIARDADVADRVARGHTLARIADDLGIGISTAHEAHRRHLARQDQPAPCPACGHAPHGQTP